MDDDTRSEIDAMITQRIVTFHDALVRRGQIKDVPEGGPSIHQSSASVFRGLTVIYGTCIRAGGDCHESAQIKLLDGKHITIRLKSEDLAKEMGKRLYQVVGLYGEATWDSRSQEMTEFRADHLTEYSDRNSDGSERTFVQSLEALARAAGNRCDNIDPDAFVQEQRRG